MQINNLGSRIVNAYLIPEKDGYVLIDTGYEDGFKNFSKKLSKAGIDPHKISYVFLTHAHDDHAGFLNDILAISDAKVILHPKAIERLKIGQNSFEGGCSGRLADFFCKVLKLFGKGDHRFPVIKDEYLSRLITVDSQEFKYLDLSFEVIGTPGHTSDHIALLKDGILFCGDAAMNGFPSTKRVTIWVENLAQFEDSWKKMIALEPSIIYPAHGKPFPVSDLKKYLDSLDKIKLYPLK